MDGQTDGWTNESPPVFYRTSSPLGPLPKNRPQTQKKLSVTDRPMDGRTNRLTNIASPAHATKNVVRRKGWGKLPRILTHNIVLTIFSNV